MSHKLYSSDFQHPDTGVLIHFVLDEDAELLWLEPCEATCEQRERVEFGRGGEPAHTVQILKISGGKRLLPDGLIQ